MLFHAKFGFLIVKANHKKNGQPLSRFAIDFTKVFNQQKS